MHNILYIIIIIADSTTTVGKITATVWFVVIVDLVVAATVLD